MYKGSLYVCDECGKEGMYDGFPKEWFSIEIRQGSILSEEKEMLEVDCCSQTCVDKQLRKYLSQRLQHSEVGFTITDYPPVDTSDT